MFTAVTSLQYEQLKFHFVLPDHIAFWPHPSFSQMLCTLYHLFPCNKHTYNSVYKMSQWFTKIMHNCFLHTKNRLMVLIITKSFKHKQNYFHSVLKYRWKLYVLYTKIQVCMQVFRPQDNNLYKCNLNFTREGSAPKVIRKCCSLFVPFFIKCIYYILFNYWYSGDIEVLFVFSPTVFIWSYSVTWASLIVIY